MKRFYISCLVLLAVSICCIAELEREKIYIDNTYAGQGNKTNSAVAYFDGYLEEIYITVPSASTSTVTIATARETLLTATSISSSTLYRPRYPYNTAAGAVIGSTNDLVKAALWSDWVTVTVTNNGTNALNDTSVYITTKK